MRNQYQKELNGIHRCVEISQHTTINIGSVKITNWMEYVWEKKPETKQPKAYGIPWHQFLIKMKSCNSYNKNKNI